MGIITGKFPQLPVFKTLAVVGGVLLLIQMAPIAQDARYRLECIESVGKEYNSSLNGTLRRNGAEG